MDIFTATVSPASAAVIPCVQAQEQKEAETERKKIC
jgi:hypothetical protein